MSTRFRAGKLGSDLGPALGQDKQTVAVAQKNQASLELQFWLLNGSPGPVSVPLPEVFTRQKRPSKALCLYHKALFNPSSAGTFLTALKEASN